MLTVGDKFPAFALTAVNGTDPARAFAPVTNETYAGRWLVVFAWPKDFTFVCPTEIVGFDGLAREFGDREAQLLGLSVDSEYVHLAWRQSRDDLGRVSFPWLADIKRELSTALGILDRNEGVALRATFIVDPEGVIRFVAVNDLRADPGSYDSGTMGLLCQASEQGSAAPQEGAACVFPS
jgi:lipoyl-dependent peroxiredoxin subunit C